MAYVKPENKWPWRDFLTFEEKEKLVIAAEVKRHWEELNKDRAMIVNCAIQRAKYAARRAAKE